MLKQQTILVLGATGRTGRRVVEQLLKRGVNVRAIVRSSEKLPAEILEDSRLTLIEAGLLFLTDDELRSHVNGCDAVISCLGHVLSFKGVFGKPRDLVKKAVVRLTRAIETLQPPKPIKLILMSSVSVHRRGDIDSRRGLFERVFLWILRKVLPPADDNQLAADFLCDHIEEKNQFVQWAAIRPDSLLEGDISEYRLHEGLVSSIFRPDATNMANVAHFMCELSTNPQKWEQWKGKLPVIINISAPES